MSKMAQEKVKYALRIDQQLQQEVKDWFPKDNCRSQNEFIEKGTLCKMARGEMVRFLAENRIERAEDCKAFSGLGYRFDEGRSDEHTYVFVLRQEVQDD